MFIKRRKNSHLCRVKQKVSGVRYLNWLHPDWGEVPLRPSETYYTFWFAASHCSRIMTSNTPQSFLKNFLKTRKSWLSWNSPPLSPDHNHMKHLWGHLKTEKTEHPVRRQEALWINVESCWDNVSRQILDKLVESIPAQVHIVFKAKFYFVVYITLFHVLVSTSCLCLFSRPSAHLRFHSK